MITRLRGLSRGSEPAGKGAVQSAERRAQSRLNTPLPAVAVVITSRRGHCIEKRLRLKLFAETDCRRAAVFGQVETGARVRCGKNGVGATVGREGRDGGDVRAAGTPRVIPARAGRRCAGCPAAPPPVTHQ